MSKNVKNKIAEPHHWTAEDLVTDLDQIKIQRRLWGASGGGGCGGDGSL